VRRDLPELESRARQQRAPLRFGSFLSAEECEHVQVDEPGEVRLGPVREDFFDEDLPSAGRERASAVAQDRAGALIVPVVED
jgi:hypothetical protein